MANSSQNREDSASGDISIPQSRVSWKVDSILPGEESFQREHSFSSTKEECCQYTPGPSKEECCSAQLWKGSLTAELPESDISFEYTPDTGFRCLQASCSQKSTEINQDHDEQTSASGSWFEEDWHLINVEPSVQHEIVSSNSESFNDDISEFDQPGPSKGTFLQKFDQPELHKQNNPDQQVVDDEHHGCSWLQENNKTETQNMPGPSKSIRHSTILKKSTPDKQPHAEDKRPVNFEWLGKTIQDPVDCNIHSIQDHFPEVQQLGQSVDKETQKHVHFDQRADCELMDSFEKRLNEYTDCELMDSCEKRLNEYADCELMDSRENRLNEYASEKRLEADETEPDAVENYLTRFRRNTLPPSLLKPAKNVSGQLKTGGTKETMQRNLAIVVNENTSANTDPPQNTLHNLDSTSCQYQQNMESTNQQTLNKITVESDQPKDDLLDNTNSVSMLNSVTLTPHAVHHSNINQSEPSVQEDSISPVMGQAEKRSQSHTERMVALFTNLHVKQTSPPAQSEKTRRMKTHDSKIYDCIQNFDERKVVSMDDANTCPITVHNQRTETVCSPLFSNTKILPPSSVQRPKHNSDKEQPGIPDTNKQSVEAVLLVLQSMQTILVRMAKMANSSNANSSEDAELLKDPLKLKRKKPPWKQSCLNDKEVMPNGLFAYSIAHQVVGQAFKKIVELYPECYNHEQLESTSERDNRVKESLSVILALTAMKDTLRELEGAGANKSYISTAVETSESLTGVVDDMKPNVQELGEQKQKESRSFIFGIINELVEHVTRSKTGNDEVDSEDNDQASPPYDVRGRQTDGLSKELKRMSFELVSRTLQAAVSVLVKTKANLCSDTICAKSQMLLPPNADNKDLPGSEIETNQQLPCSLVTEETAQRNNESAAFFIQSVSDEIHGLITRLFNHLESVSSKEEQHTAVPDAEPGTSSATNSSFHIKCHMLGNSFNLTTVNTERKTPSTVTEHLQQSNTSHEQVSTGSRNYEEHNGKAINVHVQEDSNSFESLLPVNDPGWSSPSTSEGKPSKIQRYNLGHTDSRSEENGNQQSAHAEEACQSDESTRCINSGSQTSDNSLDHLFEMQMGSCNSMRTSEDQLLLSANLGDSFVYPTPSALLGMQAEENGTEEHVPHSNGFGTLQFVNSSNLLVVPPGRLQMSGGNHPEHVQQADQNRPSSSDAPNIKNDQHLGQKAATSRSVTVTNAGGKKRSWNATCAQYHIQHRTAKFVGSIYKYKHSSSEPKLDFYKRTKTLDCPRVRRCLFNCSERDNSEWTVLSFSPSYNSSNMNVPDNQGGESEPGSMYAVEFGEDVTPTEAEAILESMAASLQRDTVNHPSRVVSDAANQHNITAQTHIPTEKAVGKDCKMSCDVDDMKTEAVTQGCSKTVNDACSFSQVSCRDSMLSACHDSQAVSQNEKENSKENKQLLSGTDSSTQTYLPIKSGNSEMSLGRTSCCVCKPSHNSVNTGDSATVCPCPKNVIVSAAAANACHQQSSGVSPVCSCPHSHHLTGVCSPSACFTCCQHRISSPLRPCNLQYQTCTNLSSSCHQGTCLPFLTADCGHSRPLCQPSIHCVNSDTKAPYGRCSRRIELSGNCYIRHTCSDSVQRICNSGSTRCHSASACGQATSLNLQLDGNDKNINSIGREMRSNEKRLRAPSVTNTGNPHGAADIVRHKISHLQEQVKQGLQDIELTVTAVCAANQQNRKAAGEHGIHENTKIAPGSKRCFCLAHCSTFHQHSDTQRPKIDEMQLPKSKCIHSMCCAHSCKKRENSNHQVSAAVESNHRCVFASRPQKTRSLFGLSSSECPGLSSVDKACCSNAACKNTKAGTCVFHLNDSSSLDFLHPASCHLHEPFMAPSRTTDRACACEREFRNSLGTEKQCCSRPEFKSSSKCSCHGCVSCQAGINIERQTNACPCNELNEDCLLLEVASADKQGSETRNECRLCTDVQEKCNSSFVVQSLDKIALNLADMETQTDTDMQTHAKPAQFDANSDSRNTGNNGNSTSYSHGESKLDSNKVNVGKINADNTINTTCTHHLSEVSPGVVDAAFTVVETLLNVSEGIKENHKGGTSHCYRVSTNSVDHVDSFSQSQDDLHDKMMQSKHSGNPGGDESTINKNICYITAADSVDKKRLTSPAAEEPEDISFHLRCRSDAGICRCADGDSDKRSVYCDTSFQSQSCTNDASEFCCNQCNSSNVKDTAESKTKTNVDVKQLNMRPCHSENEHQIESNTGHSATSEQSLTKLHKRLNREVNNENRSNLKQRKHTAFLVCVGESTDSSAMFIQPVPQRNAIQITDTACQATDEIPSDFTETGQWAESDSSEISVARSVVSPILEGESFETTEMVRCRSLRKHGAINCTPPPNLECSSSGVYASDSNAFNIVADYPSKSVKRKRTVNKVSSPKSVHSKTSSVIEGVYEISHSACETCNEMTSTSVYPPTNEAERPAAPDGDKQVESGASTCSPVHSRCSVSCLIDGRCAKENIENGAVSESDCCTAVKLPDLFDPVQHAFSGTADSIVTKLSSRSDKDIGMVSSYVENASAVHGCNSPVCDKVSVAPCSAVSCTAAGAVDPDVTCDSHHDIEFMCGTGYGSSHVDPGNTRMCAGQTNSDADIYVGFPPVSLDSSHSENTIGAVFTPSGHNTDLQPDFLLTTTSGIMDPADSQTGNQTHVSQQDSDLTNSSISCGNTESSFLHQSVGSIEQNGRCSLQGLKMPTSSVGSETEALLSEVHEQQGITAVSPCSSLSSVSTNITSPGSSVTNCRAPSSHVDPFVSLFDSAWLKPELSGSAVSERDRPVTVSNMCTLESEKELRWSGTAVDWNTNLAASEYDPSPSSCTDVDTDVLERKSHSDEQMLCQDSTNNSGCRDSWASLQLLNLSSRATRLVLENRVQSLQRILRKMEDCHEEVSSVSFEQTEIQQQSPPNTPNADLRSTATATSSGEHWLTACTSEELIQLVQHQLKDLKANKVFQKLQPAASESTKDTNSNHIVTVDVSTNTSTLAMKNIGTVTQAGERMTYSDSFGVVDKSDIGVSTDDNEAKVQLSNYSDAFKSRGKISSVEADHFITNPLTCENSFRVNTKAYSDISLERAGVKPIVDNVFQAVPVSRVADKGITMEEKCATPVNVKRIGDWLKQSEAACSRRASTVTNIATVNFSDTFSSLKSCHRGVTADLKPSVVNLMGSSSAQETVHRGACAREVKGKNFGSEESDWREGKEEKQEERRRKDIQRTVTLDNQTAEDRSMACNMGVQCQILEAPSTTATQTLGKKSPNNLHHLPDTTGVGNHFFKLPALQKSEHLQQQDVQAPLGMLKQYRKQVKSLKHDLRLEKDLHEITKSSLLSLIQSHEIFRQRVASILRGRYSFRKYAQHYF